MQALLRSVVSQPQESMYRAPLMQESDRAELLSLNPRPEADPADLCLHQLFERQADARPEARCLKLSPDSDSWLTYGQVEAKANRIAHRLTSLGVAADAIVAVCATRGPGLYIAMLAILKAGAAYLPMDANYPAERLAYMVEVSGVKCLLTDTELQSHDSLPKTEQVRLCADFHHKWPITSRLAPQWPLLEAESCWPSCFCAFAAHSRHHSMLVKSLRSLLSL